ncbi:MAG TPA: glycine cleavage system protein GcvH [Vicinamibacterales bacterium]|jgi:glycine cleavage system H protein|nr:glycine cleavage system protein GcvH [Vicinamibacterales bacterium]|tara:strand:+ start:476 stop:847 length:372 start_codon:yes stop_codon:yes gene_type:complete
MYPDDRRYSKDHEWIVITDGGVKVGITHYAQDQLGDVVYVELPEVGRQLKQGEIFGTIESVKAVSELFCPVTGKVTAVNADLNDHPELVNSTPHETWMICLSLDDPSQVDSLLDAASYRSSIE